MLNHLRFVLTSVEFIPVLSTRFAARLSGCLVLTALNFAVAFTCAPCLAQVSAHHPVWFGGVIALFAGLLGSLLRVWFLLVFGSRIQ